MLNRRQTLAGLAALAAPRPVAAASEAEAAELLTRAGLTPVKIAPGARPRRPRAKLDHRAAACAASPRWWRRKLPSTGR